MHCWWSCDLIKPFWMVIWNYAQRVLKSLLIQPYHCWVCTPKTSKEKDVCKNISSCALCSGKKVENKGMHFNWGMAEKIMGYAGDGIILCPKE